MNLDKFFELVKPRSELGKQKEQERKNKRKTMTFHNIKDIVMIYSSGNDGKPDYTWDNAQIKVWNPTEQREMDLVFTGSERPNDQHPGKINFNVNYKDDTNDVFDAFCVTMKSIFPNIEESTLKEYQKRFMQDVVNIRFNTKVKS